MKILGALLITSRVLAAEGGMDGSEIVLAGLRVAPTKTELLAAGLRVAVTVKSYDRTGKARVLTRPTVFTTSGRTAKAEYDDVPGVIEVYGWSLTPTLLEDGRVKVHAVVTVRTGAQERIVLLDSTNTARMNEKATVRVGDWELTTTASFGNP